MSQLPPLEPVLDNIKSSADELLKLIEEIRPSLSELWESAGGLHTELTLNGSKEAQGQAHRLAPYVYRIGDIDAHLEAIIEEATALKKLR